ncbi:MAG TPA: thiamine-phosphate kinase [Actinomycetota bacterium]
MATEDELVRAIKKLLSGEEPGVVVPIGDDAAVVEPGGHHLVVTVDTLVERVHFDPDVAQPDDLGYKAVVVNVSDVAAMGGSPRYAVVSLAVPPDTRPAWVIELYGGMRAAAEDYGLALVGGDTVRADQCVLTVTVLGTVAEGRAVTRSGARPGDRIVVTGSLGAAAGGLRLVQGREGATRRAVMTGPGRELVAALDRPVARVGEGEALAQAGATSMIDVSDGLALDLSRVCEASGVGARVRLPAVPVAEALKELAEEIGVDPLDLALHGGEDYELVATLPAAAVEDARARLLDRYGTPLTDIGEIIETGLLAVGEDGRERPLEAKGWDHFG